MGRGPERSELGVDGAHGGSVPQGNKSIVPILNMLLALDVEIID